MGNNGGISVGIIREISYTTLGIIHVKFEENNRIISAIVKEKSGINCELSKETVGKVFK